jgi:molybdenum-dependent DNA-binding transcriptional regulator ModE
VPAPNEHVAQKGEPLLKDDNQDLFDIRRLALLVEVVEQGSITAAAELMMYTPSAVSQQLRKLEQEVGQPLLNRRSRGVVPTEAGQVLSGHARKIIGQMRAAQSDLDQIAGVKRGSLTIGTFPTLAGSFLPVVIRAFKRGTPPLASPCEAHASMTSCQTCSLELPACACCGTTLGTAFRTIQSALRKSSRKAPSSWYPARTRLPAAMRSGWKSSARNRG